MWYNNLVYISTKGDSHMKKQKFVFILIISIFMLCACGPQNDVPDSDLSDPGTPKVEDTQSPNGLQPPDSSDNSS